MRHLLFAALLLLCCAYGCIANTRYGSPYVNDPNKEPEGPTADTEDPRIWDVRVVDVTKENSKHDWQNIRIAVNPKMVQDELVYCLVKGFGPMEYTLNIHSGFDPKVCDAVRRYGSTRMARTLLVDVIPKAMRMHVERLKVKPVKGKLRIDMPSGQSAERDNEGTMCDEMVRRLDGKDGMGIPNADFVIYLGLSTRYPGTKICSYDENGRPTSAIIKLNPYDIDNTDHYIRVVAHEIAHGLGFSTDVKEFGSLVVNGEQNGHPGQEELDSKKIREEVQEQFRCETYVGMKLDDAELENGKEHVAHFDGELAKNELMAPLSTKGGAMKYTALTLAALESTGHYQAIYSMAEKMESKKFCPSRRM